MSDAELVPAPLSGEHTLTAEAHLRRLVGAFEDLFEAIQGPLTEFTEWLDSAEGQAYIAAANAAPRRMETGDIRGGVIEAAGAARAPVDRDHELASWSR